MDVMNQTGSYSVGSDAFGRSITMGDYYRLKEKFCELENQIEEAEKAAATSAQAYMRKDRIDIEFLLNRLENNLEIVRALVKEYCKKFTIETNFTFRLQECEKRADAFVQGLIHHDMI